MGVLSTFITSKYTVSFFYNCDNMYQYEIDKNTTIVKKPFFFIVVERSASNRRWRRNRVIAKDLKNCTNCGYVRCA